MKVSYQIVAHLVGKGWSYKEIALFKRVSPSTIRNMVVSDKYLSMRYTKAREKEQKAKELKQQQLKLGLWRI